MSGLWRHIHSPNTIPRVCCSSRERRRLEAGRGEGLDAGGSLY